MTHSSRPLLSGQIRITFKNVGQGDSIIVEWLNRDNVLQVGIIDCKLAPDGSNPVLDYLKSLDAYTLSFIVFTHPHKDHYDGSIGLMDYLLDNNRRVEHLLGTFWFDPNFITRFAKAEAILLNNFIDAKAKIRHLVRQSAIALDTGFDLVDNVLKLKCFAPSGEELMAFQEKLRIEQGEKFSSGTQAANYLSTVIMIEGKDSYILFTADAHESVFESFLPLRQPFINKSLRLAQVPHHGAAHNYVERFWSKLKKEPDCVAAVSVGKNNYGHPSEQVLRALHKNRYIVHFTASVNGAKFFLKDLSAEELEKIRSLDHDTVPLEQSAGRDLPYCFNDFF